MDVRLQIWRKYLVAFAVILAIIVHFSNSLVLADSANVSVTIAVTECSDGTDNDFDGLIDYPNDPDCDTLSDDDESTPPAPPPPVVDSGGGGGSSGSSGTPRQQITDLKPQITSILFEGFATPFARVVVLRNGFNYLSGQTDSLGKFSMEDKQTIPGSYTFSLKSFDKEGRESALVTFSIVIPKDRAVFARGIIIPPTIELSSDNIRAGGEISVFGETIPNSEVKIVVEDRTFSLRSDSSGVYRDRLRLELPDGSYVVRANVSVRDDIPRFSTALLLRVGNIDLSRNSSVIGDLDGNNKVDLIDFSILAFWYRKSNVPARVDLNGDGLVDLKDMSVLAYNWTG